VREDGDSDLQGTGAPWPRQLLIAYLGFYGVAVLANVIVYPLLPAAFGWTGLDILDYSLVFASGMDRGAPASITLGRTVAAVATTGLTLLLARLDVAGLVVNALYRIRSVTFASALVALVGVGFILLMAWLSREDTSVWLIAAWVITASIAGLSVIATRAGRRTSTA